MYRKIISTMTVGIMIGVTTISVQAETKLNDTYSHWANKQIQEFINNGCINGYEDGTFKPDNSITRAEFIKIVNNYFGFSSKSNKSFNDVSSRDWFYNDVCIAKEAGYINGYEDGNFRPDKTITREEVAKIFVSIKHNKDFTYDKIQNFVDSSNVSEWAKPYVEGAIEAKYINGNEKGELNLTNNITRAEAVVMISRVDKKIGNPWDDDPVLVPPSNQAPRIEFKNITLNQGDKFDPSMLDIRVVDPEDGILSTSNVQIISKVDTNKPGTYIVTLKIADKEGYESVEYAKVTVKEKAEISMQDVVDRINSSSFQSQVRAEMIRLVNEHRAANGLKQYVETDDLNELASNWSNHMADLEFCDHVDINGQHSGDIYGNESSLENVLMTSAYEDTTPKSLAQDMFNMWKNSSGHNNAMLNDMQNEMGFGYSAVCTDGMNVRVYATQEFNINWDMENDVTYN